MAIPIAPLPYAIDALEPIISATALKTHYEEHYKGYVKKVNELVQDTIYSGLTLKDIVLKSDKKNTFDREAKIFNNANQAWNHVFYFNCLTDVSNAEPSKELVKKINESFGSLQTFKDEFSSKGADLFGSGWVWLVVNKNAELEIVTGKNAENPLPSGNVPVFVFDVWEHAYYIDFRSDRKSYTEKLWQMANWSFMENEMLRAEKFQKNKGRYQDFFARPSWSSVSPSIILRRKSSVRGGALIGAAVGIVVFFFLSLMVNFKVIPLPGLTNAAGASHSGLTLFVGVMLGMFIGAACGTLVGIGTPVPLSDPDGSLGN